MKRTPAYTEKATKEKAHVLTLSPLSPKTEGRQLAQLPETSGLALFHTLHSYSIPYP